MPADYADWLSGLKQRIQGARQRASLAVNRELILLYWQIGREILQRQQAQGWGSKVIERLAQDLRAEFPEMKGFSARNLKYMRSFAEAWAEEVIVQQTAAQLPWFHLCTLVDKLKTKKERDWYAAKAIEHGWSRAILVMQIEPVCISGRVPRKIISPIGCRHCNLIWLEKPSKTLICSISWGWVRRRMSGILKLRWFST